MKKAISTFSATLFFFLIITQLNANNIRLKEEQGYTKQGNVFIKVDSLYYNYPNPSVGDEWGNDFSEMYTFRRDSANQLFSDNGYKSVFEYDANMKELSRTYYYLDNSNWVLDLKWEITYNGQGQAVKFSRYILVSNVLQENYRITRTFNTNGYLIEQLEQQVSNGVATNVYNKIYTRDANGNLTDYIYQTWNNNTWVNNSRTISTFITGTALADTVVRYDWVSNAWRPLSRDVNTYNTNGLNTLQNIEAYNTNTQLWDNYRKIEKSYNASGKISSWDDYSWIGSWKLLVELSYTTYTGDYYGRCIRKEYDTNTGQTENRFRYDNVFNQDGWRIKNKQYEWLNNTWQEVSYTDYTFEEVVLSGISNLNEEKFIKAYPNPFTQNTFIEFETIRPGETTIEIYNTTGQKIQQYQVNTIQGANNLLWQGDDMNGYTVPAGVYLVRIQNGNSLQFTRLIKQ